MSTTTTPITAIRCLIKLDMVGEGGGRGGEGEGGRERGGGRGGEGKGDQTVPLVSPAVEH